MKYIIYKQPKREYNLLEPGYSNGLELLVTL